MALPPNWKKRKATTVNKQNLRNDLIRLPGCNGEDKLRCTFVGVTSMRHIKLLGSGFVCMAHFKFLLDRGVTHLAHCFSEKRVLTTDSLGLSELTPDEEIVEIASNNGYLLIAANRRNFRRLVPAHIAKSTRKPDGCRRVAGLILLVPNEQHVQERVLSSLEDKMSLDGKKLTYKDVHDRDLLVQVESTGAAKITKLPRCPYCKYEDQIR